MNKMLAVARWEFIEKVKTKAFIIGLFMTPLIMSVFMVLPGLLSKSEKETTKKIGVIDETRMLSSLINAKLHEKYKLSSGIPTYELYEITDENRETDHLKIIATAQLISGQIEGYFVIPMSVMDSGKVEYRAENVGNVRDQNRFSNVLKDIIIEQRAKKAGYNPAVIKKLITEVDIKTIKVSQKGDESESGFMETFFSGYIFIMMLMFLVMSSGQMLIRSVVEEKSNRIIEVLVSSCSAKELMSGKIIGLTLLGLTTIAFWVIILIGVNFATEKPFVTVDNVMVLLLYFILGYFMYVAIFITAGSTVSTEQEAQQMTGYITILLVLPIALAVPVMMNPDSTLVKVLSQIPLLTPTMMALRFSVRVPDLWEIILSLVTLSGTIAGLMWVAAKVFRIGILITGKRPNIKEIVGWLRNE
ncbi:MAG: ABC transporter permease [Ignavibacteriales bacterium]|nr:ABC transporter permease [Ignavibacteriales bacterium]